MHATTVALLDALELERLPVVAHSAGATSALQMALRHPDRISGLALISPNAPGLDLTVPPKPVARALFGSDLAFWLLARYRHAHPESMLGVPNGYKLNPEDVDSLRALTDTMLPHARAATAPSLTPSSPVETSASIDSRRSRLPRSSSARATTR